MMWTKGGTLEGILKDILEDRMDKIPKDILEEIKEHDVGTHTHTVDTDFVQWVANQNGIAISWLEAKGLLEDDSWKCSFPTADAIRQYLWNNNTLAKGVLPLKLRQSSDYRIISLDYESITRKPMLDCIPFPGHPDKRKGYKRFTLFKGYGFKSD